ncbi:MAG: hypothetical protein ACK5P7_00805, partial [Bdellovibrio sp.]
APEPAPAAPEPAPAAPEPAPAAPEPAPAAPEPAPAAPEPAPAAHEPAPAAPEPAPVAAPVAAAEPAAIDLKPPSKVEPEFVGRARAAPIEEVAGPAPATAVTTEASPQTPAPAEAPPQTPAPPEVADDDLIKEFAAAVEEQQVVEEPAGPDAKPQDDALSEFESAAASVATSSVVDAAPVPAENLDLGKMDLDKMVAEATGLETIKTDETATNALENGMDSNRLLEEAASMETIKPGDAQLMGDFEKFVKKGGAP